MLALSFVLGVVTPVIAFKCNTDVELTNVQDYLFDLPRIAGDKTYWKNYHLTYFLFGEFKESPDRSAAIRASYKAEGENPIYELEVDCAAGTWRTLYNSDKNGTMKTYKEGTLEEPCQEGIWDIILKVDEKWLMKWLFNGQEMDYTTRMTTNMNNSTSAGNIPSGVKSFHGLHFGATATGTAEFTRFAFGKCIAWPVSIRDNCNDVKAWLRLRGKQDVTTSDKAHAGVFSAYNNVFKVDCYRGNGRYYAWIQQGVHPDRLFPYCCCVDMETGVLYQDDGVNLCTETDGTVCPLMCLETYDPDIVLGDALKVLERPELQAD